MSAPSATVRLWRELTTRELSRDNKFLPAAAPTTRRWLLFLRGWNSDSRKARPAHKEAADEERDCTEQGGHLRRIFQQPLQEPRKPGILGRRSQRGKPHLPVEARLVRKIPRRSPHDVARFVFERIFAPVNAIVRAFDDDFRPRGSHHREQAIRIDDAQRRNFIVDPRGRGGDSAAEHRMNLYKTDQHNQQRERIGDKETIFRGFISRTRGCINRVRRCGRILRSAASSNSTMHKAIVRRLKKV